MKQNSYPVGTIFEMAQIPEEALPRFMDELPGMLGTIRKLKALYETLETAVDGEFSIQLDAPVWIDDDKRERTLDFVDEAGGLLHSVTFPIDGAA